MAFIPRFTSISGVQQGVGRLIAQRRQRIQEVQRIGGFWFLIAAVLVLLAIAVTVLGNGPTSVDGGVISPTPTPTESHAPRIYSVSYRAGVFSPTNLRIHAGDTVRFKNDGILPIHIVSSDLAGFDSIGDVPPDSSFTFTFAEPGTFGYYNQRDTSEAGAVMVK